MLARTEARGDSLTLSFDPANADDILNAELGLDFDPKRGEHG